MQKNPKALPYGRHLIDDDDIASVAACLRSDFLTTGPLVSAFEDAFAKKVNAPHAVVMSNGTTALHLAMRALNIGPGDAVIVPSISFLASANCVEYVGAEVVFADVDSDTGLMEAHHLEQAYNAAEGKNLRAVIPVHLNGQTADLERIHAFAKAKNLMIVEDACHALGTELITKTGQTTVVGDCTYASLAMFSGHPVKTLAMGEGGILTCKDEHIAERLRHLRSHGIERNPARFENRDLAFAPDGQPNPWYYEMQEIGYNYRESDILCALGLSQLAKLERFVEKRRALVHAYLNKLPKLQPHVLPLRHNSQCRAGWHLFPVFIDFEGLNTSRKDVMQSLSQSGINTQVHYIPISEQPYYKKKYGAQNMPGAMAYYNKVLSLPLFPAMEEDDVTFVLNRLDATLHEASSRKNKLYG